MNLINALYNTLVATGRTVPFSRSDALLVFFLHDIEKPWKYELGPDGQWNHVESLMTKAQAQEFRLKLLKEYDFQLTDAQLTALKYAEGELDDYSSRERKMNPLGALVHSADVLSARLWFDRPREQGDAWSHTARIRDAIK